MGTLRGLFSLFPSTGPSAMFSPPLLAFSSYLLLLIGAARAQVIAPNCTDTSLYSWVGSFLLRRSFCIDNESFCSHRADMFSRTIRSNKVPAWSQRTCRRCVTMAVSTCSFGEPYALLIAFCRILHSCFAAPKLIHGTEWDRRRRSLQMQHRRIQPHQRMRRLPGIVVDCVR